MTRSADSLWPQAHIDMLKALRERSRSFAEIAAEMNETFQTSYSRNAIVGKATRMGLPKQSPVRRNQPSDHIPRKKWSKTPVVPKSAPLNLIEAKNIEPLNLAFAELAVDSCRYPYGHLPPFQFCGHSVAPGSPYCEPHERLCCTTVVRR